MIFDKITAQPVIETDRFLMRPVRKSDAGLLKLHMSDKRVAEACRAVPHPLPPGAIDAYIARAMADGRGEDVWVMDGATSGLSGVLGVSWLTRMDREQSEITFWVVPAFWNAGIASEAVRALVIANPHEAKTMFAEVFQDNPASARVITNAGFEYLGDAEAFSVARGTTVPTWTYINRLRN